MTSFSVFKGSKDGKIVKSQTSVSDLKDGEVLVRITASGVCGTDIHYESVDMVLGHEGVGTVEDIGPNVHRLKKGDRVGWGYVHKTCGHCEWCLTGRETYCPEREMYGEKNFDKGSFAEKCVWNEAFLFKVPDTLGDKEAAPLMCGGATVWNALRMYDVQPTDRVGVLGVGGLGHLAIQFASKMGCNVVVLSGTESKKEEATKLGANQFVAMKGKKELDIGPKINCLLVTTSAQPDWDLLLPVMAPDSKIFPLTVSQGNLSIPYMPVLLNGIRIQGTVVAPRQIHRQMLEFASLHDIKPMINEFPMAEDGITEAMDALKNGKMRYRGVLIPQN